MQLIVFLTQSHQIRSKEGEEGMWDKCKWQVKMSSLLNLAYISNQQQPPLSFVYFFTLNTDSVHCFHNSASVLTRIEIKLELFNFHLVQYLLP